MTINKTKHHKAINRLNNMRASGVALSLLCCSVGFVHAADEPDNSVSAESSHWSLGSALTALDDSSSDLSESENSTQLSTTGVVVNRFNVEDARFGWKFNIGFDLTRNLAIKAGYMDLNDNSGETNAVVSDPAIFNSYSKKGPTTSAEGFSLGSVYRYNVTDSLDFTGSVGLFNWESDGDVQALDGAQGTGDQVGGTDIYFGLGGGYQLTNDVSLSIEWEHYKLNDENTDMLSIGVNYHFK